MTSVRRSTVWPLLVAAVAVVPAASQVLRARAHPPARTAARALRDCPACAEPQLRVARRAAAWVLFCPGCQKSWWTNGRARYALRRAPLERLSRA